MRTIHVHNSAELFLIFVATGVYPTIKMFLVALTKFFTLNSVGNIKLFPLLVDWFVSDITYTQKDTAIQSGAPQHFKIPERENTVKTISYGAFSYRYT